ncbi:PAS domain S-box protein [Allomyces macrogynus ATCC 38327]|uniref:PAS domain S-box protein n=1 Tax=Allomyces macrogynus (strain ATCC 38327) TaxID=578462 RepID=A0A0L0SS65_ALLM3|nr:PAS domain S-box protein [Allomyces macrogynus ATCC 38327]|eukprot:KNE65204.1 PAS domain S-box protein [Allomyces macrogynus ATCC 38327]
MSDGPVTIIPTNERGFIIWVKAMSRTTADADTPFTSWLSAATIEITTLLGATLSNHKTTEGVFVEIIHPTGDLIFSTVPNNDTRRRDLHSSWQLIVPVLNQQWTCKCWASNQFQNSLVTRWPSVVGAVTAIIFLLAGEALRRGVLRYFSSRRLLQQYHVQNRLLSTLSRYSKAIIEALPDCLLVVNERGRILGINKAVLDVTGYSVLELETTPVTEIVFPMILDLRFRTPSLAPSEYAPTSPLARAPAAPRAFQPTAAHPWTTSSSRSAADNTSARRIVIAEPPTMLASFDTASSDESGNMLDVGFFEGTVRRSDGTTFLASIAVNATTGIEDRRAMLDHAIAAGVTPLISLQRQLLDDEIAQVVLFHDISDQIQAQRMAGAARGEEREATKSKNSLLRFLAQALLPQTLGIHDALVSIQHRIRGVALGPDAPLRARQASGDSMELPLNIHARISSRTADEDIDAATATAQHMVVLMEDLALLIGTPFCARYRGDTSPPTAGVSLHRLQAEALHAQANRTAAKHMRVTTAVDPPSVVVGGNLTTLRVLMAKMLYLGSSVALPDSTWDIKYTVTHADRAFERSPSPTTSTSTGRSSSVSVTAPTHRPRPCRLRDASHVPSAHQQEEPVSCAPLSIHLRQTLSAMDKSVILDDLELSLQHGSRGSDFGSLALTFVGLATFVKRIGGVLVRSDGPVTGACTFDVEVPLAQLDVWVTFPSVRGAGTDNHVAQGLE